MPGTLVGGRKAADTNKKRYGDSFYQKIGHTGGSWKGRKGFAAMPKDKVREYGRIGGYKSRRGPAENSAIAATYANTNNDSSNVDEAA